jgi:predicted RNA-binding protein with PIN domain
MWLVWRRGSPLLSPASILDLEQARFSPGRAPAAGPRRRPVNPRRRLPAEGGPSSPVPPEEMHPEQFRWIVDGHNAIFAVPAWEDLQVAGERRQARQCLEESLETFGRAIGAQIWVVYDGNRLERNPDAVALPHLHTEYSNPPEEADDRILFLVARALREGEKPLVVTSDRKTLAGRLPPGTRYLEVGRFFRRVYPRRVHAPEKWEPSEMRDVEEHFLRLSGEGASEGQEPAPGE